MGAFVRAASGFALTAPCTYVGIQVTFAAVRLCGPSRAEDQMYPGEEGA